MCVTKPSTSRDAHLSLNLAAGVTHGGPSDFASPAMARPRECLRSHKAFVRWAPGGRSITCAIQEHTRAVNQVSCRCGYRHLGVVGPCTISASQHSTHCRYRDCGGLPGAMPTPFANFAHQRHRARMDPHPHIRRTSCPSDILTSDFDICPASCPPIKLLVRYILLALWP